MNPKKKKSKETDMTEFLMQLAGGGVALAEKGLSFAEELAKERRLYKSYPYLSQAFSNVKNMIGFLKTNLVPCNTCEEKTYDRPKGRTKRKAGHKKVSK